MFVFEALFFLFICLELSFKKQNVRAVDMMLDQQKYRMNKYPAKHSMAKANLNKSVWLVTNTTAASKYIPRRPRISIN